MKKTLGFATSLAFAASLAFASLSLPFIVGQANAQNTGQKPGTFACGFGTERDCEGTTVDSFIEFEIETIIWVIVDNDANYLEQSPVNGDGAAIAIDGVDVPFSEPNLTDEIQTMTDPALAALQGAESEHVNYKITRAAELADAEAFRLQSQQSQARWACRGVPLALKHLLCAKKI